MDEKIRAEICRYVCESPENRFPDSEAPYFDGPLVGFAAADDHIFEVYRKVIGPFHKLPADFLPEAATVISWILPITATTRSSNRVTSRYPSMQWAQTRHHGEALNRAVRIHLAGYLASLGHTAVAPQLHQEWQELSDSPVGIASTWSERHAAYACGLGTFSLNDGLITAKGIAHRCGSVITSLAIPTSVRPIGDHRANCLYFREGSCGACIARCPVGALSKLGHDKMKCRDFVYGEAPETVAERYGVSSTGCGLCQTKVPCESCIPAGRAMSP